MSIDAVLSQLVSQSLATRIWSRDPAAFAGGSPAEPVRAAILNRLGWLDAPSGMPARLAEVESFVASLAADGLTDVYLLGMGGSSLCAEVLRDVLGSGTSPFRLTVLDTTDELAIHQVTDSLVPAQSCFIVASKSGGTLEVTSLERHFRAVMAEAVQSPGQHFAAITDPDTELVAHAAASGYRQTFINPADIGGRYSALSLFGLVPAAIAGVEGQALLAPARRMADACRSDVASNPGLQLGVFMGVNARQGRDKLTLLASPSLEPLGAWIEQLVAESTGKQGKGVLPVVGEPLGEVSDYGRDRAFVAVLNERDETTRQAADALEAAGHPVFRIDTSAEQLGAEFFRWEFATAVAGAILELNPFDEPDVRGAKLRTQAQLDARQATGAFRVDPPFEDRSGVSHRELRPVPPVAASYIAILDYLPASAERASVIAQLRADLRRRTGKATTHGVGPRYLHSTGQYHKGGPNTGLFVLVTSADQTSTPVPGAGYTFSVLKHAQAFGDFDALAAVGRTVIHHHIGDSERNAEAELASVLASL